MPPSDLKDNHPNNGTPDISVILVTGGQRERAARALRSLLDQNALDRMEILLFDLGPESSPPLPGSDHPRVRVTRRGPNDLLSVARADGVRAARSPVVSFMEEHCELQPGWIEAILDAHRGPWAGVGSDMINGNPGAGLSDRAFRANYGAYSNLGHRRGVIGVIPGQNSAYKRDIILRYESQLELMLNADLVLQWKLQQDGNQLFHESKARLAHRNENSFRSLVRGVFYWNWCFAGVRAEVFKWSALRRATWIALTPLMPWVRLIRMLRWTSRQGGRFLPRFFRDIPFVLAINYCSAAGQAAGLVSAMDRGVREFSHFEMNEPRHFREELM